MTGPAFYTERAILGAILGDPTQRAILRAAGLEPHDFAHTIHHDLYTVLEQLDVDGWASRRLAALNDDSAEVEVAFYGAVLERLRAISSGYTSDAFGHSYLFDLRREVTRPRNAAAYILFLIEERLKGTVLAAAARTAEIVISGPDEDLDELLHLATRTVTAAHQIAHTLANRWGMPLPTTDAEPTDATVELPESISSHTVRDILTTAEHHHDPAETADRETRVLTGLLAQPQHLAAIATWLRPDDFQHPRRRDVYTAMLAIHKACKPVDPITLMWQLDHARHLDGTLTPEALLRLATEPTHPADPHNAALDILATSIRTRLTTHARHLADEAEQPSAGPERHIAGIGSLVTVLRTEHDRWRTTRPHYAEQSFAMPEADNDATEISAD